MRRPAPTSQSLIVLSPLPEASVFPSGLKATEYTIPLLNGPSILIFGSAVACAQAAPGRNNTIVVITGSICGSALITKLYIDILDYQRLFLMPGRSEAPHFSRHESCLASVSFFSARTNVIWKYGKMENEKVDDGVAPDLDCPAYGVDCSSPIR
jgi:hypothetical protein